MGDDGIYDLGDGKATFRAGSQVFRLDLVDFLAWRSSYTPPKDQDGNENGYAVLQAVAEEVHRRTGVQLGLGQVDALLHAIDQEFERVRLFRRSELESLRS